MPAVKDVGEPCEGEPHARFDGGREETSASRLMPRDVRRLAYPTVTEMGLERCDLRRDKWVEGRSGFS